MRVAKCATGSSAFTMRGLCRFLLRSRWTPRTAPTPATAATSLRLRGYGRGLLHVRHLLGNRLRRTTGTAGAPVPARLATTAPTVRRLWLRAGRDAPEQRLDRGADLLLHHVADHRHEASLSRHRVLPAGARYTKARSPVKSAAQRPEW